MEEFVKVTLCDVGAVLGDERAFDLDHGGWYRGPQAFDASVRVYRDGSVMVLDTVSRHYSSSLADLLTAEQRAEVERLAAIRRAIPDDLRRSIHGC